MGRPAYASRAKERVQWRWWHDHREIGGTLSPPEPPYRAFKQWVYRREDGTEFVGLGQQLAIARDADGTPYVERVAKAVRASNVLESLKGRVVKDV